MKTINSVAIVLALLFALTSCTPKMTFGNSSIAPAATGEIKVKKDKNKNYIINVSVQNLAEPNRLDPPKETYIVWMDSNKDSAKKLGQIKPASKMLKGSLSATSVDSPTDVFITAENNADVQYPDGPIILTTKK